MCRCGRPRWATKPGSRFRFSCVDSIPDDPPGSPARRKTAGSLSPTNYDGPLCSVVGPAYDAVSWSKMPARCRPSINFCGVPETAVLLTRFGRTAVTAALRDVDLPPRFPYVRCPGRGGHRRSGGSPRCQVRPFAASGIQHDRDSPSHQPRALAAATGSSRRGGRGHAQCHHPGVRSRHRPAWRA